MGGLRQAGTLLEIVVLAAAVTGCGGSGSGGPGTPSSTGSLALAIRFPGVSTTRSTAARLLSFNPLSRAGVPLGARSVRINLTDPTTNTLVAPSMVVTPPSSGSATVQFTNLPIGAVHIHASAHPDAAASQAPLALADTNATIQAGLTASAVIDFNLIGASLSLSPSSLTLTIPGSGAAPTSSLAATVADVSGSPVTGYPLVWSSSNAAIVQVQPSADGQTASVQGLEPGTAAIEVREPNTGFTAQAIVNVVTEASDLGAR